MAAVVSAGTAVAGPAAAAASVAPAAQGAGQSVPHPGSSSELFGVSCASRSCWAVGDYLNGNGADLNQALHWNGARWSKASVPSPGGSAAGDDSELFGVSCASPGSCWAVGDYRNGVRVSQALHWNGARWSSASVPSPAGAVRDILYGVRCTSSANCWAVGFYLLRNGGFVNQALHWNGRRWSLAAIPHPGGTRVGAFSELVGVACASSADCWAVGEYHNGHGAFVNQALHWNGRQWSLAVTPGPDGTGAGAVNMLRGVACASSADCWAVGFYGAAPSAGAQLNQALHWNGRNWSLAATPDPDGTGAGASNFLHGVACAAPANCWAVGTYGVISASGGVEVNQALHWNGRTWSLAATPDPAGTASGDSNQLWSVSCISPASCWAVGNSTITGGVALNQALRWKGTRWSAG